MALLLTKDLDDDGHSRLGVWHITESVAQLREATSIPSDELEEISFLKSESLRKQKLAVRALLDAMFEDKVYLSLGNQVRLFQKVSMMDPKMILKKDLEILK